MFLVANNRIHSGYVKHKWTSSKNFKQLTKLCRSQIQTQKLLENSWSHWIGGFGKITIASAVDQETAAFADSIAYIKLLRQDSRRFSTAGDGFTHQKTYSQCSCSPSPWTPSKSRSFANILISQAKIKRLCPSRKTGQENWSLASTSGKLFCVFLNSVSICYPLFIGSN